MLNIGDMQRILSGELGMPPQDAYMLAIDHMKHKREQNAAFLSEVESKGLVSSFRAVYDELKRQNEIIDRFEEKYGFEQP